MKKIKYNRPVHHMAFLVLTLCLGQEFSMAQSSSSNPGLIHLETTEAPGLLMLDAAAASIGKPTTPQGLSLSFSGFGIPAVALDLAPFWLCAHPRLTIQDLYMQKIPILSHLTVSIAAVDKMANHYATGIQTRIYQSYGRKNREWAKADSLKMGYVSILGKPLFTVDAAAAIGVSSMRNNFDNFEFSRWAAWLSMGWRPRGGDFHLTVLSRYVRNESYFNTLPQSDLVDLGARINYDLPKFTISLEWVNRLNFNPNDKFYNYRVAVSGTYKVLDNLGIFFTFGKDYTYHGNIIARAGVYAGVSRKKFKAV